MDDFLAEQRFQLPVDMIKIDVEGADMQVLRGASKTLDANPQVTLLVDIHPEHGVDPEQLCAFLKEKGFSVFPEREFSGQPLEACSDVSAIVARRYRGGARKQAGT